MFMTQAPWDEFKERKLSRGSVVEAGSRILGSVIFGGPKRYALLIEVTMGGLGVF
jgi:hypothetical protein